MNLKNKKLITNFILLFVVIILFFIFFEIFLRIIFGSKIIQDAKGNLIFIPDEELGYKMESNFKGYFKGEDFDTKINTNSQGFRNEFDFSREDKNVIFVLGDSMTFGHGVEVNETIVHQLQNELGNKYKLYNLGVPGYGQKQPLVILKKMLPVYRAEIIILNLYVGNDLANNCEITPYEIGNRLDKNKTVFEKIKAILKKSQLALFFYKSIIVPQKNPTDLPFYIDSYEIQRCYEITKEYFSEMKELADFYNSKFIFLIMGTEPQTVKAKEEALKKRYERFELYYSNKEKFDLYTINKRILEICKELEIECFDLTPVFKEKDGELILYVKDGHWNKEGHKLASQAITKYLNVNNYLN